jgi:uncharacterized membrane protein
MSAPIQLIVAAFSDPEEAGRLLEDLKAGRRAGLVGIIDAAAATKDAEGELRITNARHRGRRGLLTGGAVGGVIALLSGPIGWGAAAGGGVIGGLLGRVRNAPFRASVEDLAASLTPGSSLLVALVEHRWVEMVEEVARELGAQVLREELKADIADQLEAGGNVAFSVAADDEGTVAGGRVASGPEGHVEVSGFLAGEDGILLTDAELTDEELPAASAGAEVDEADRPGPTT